MKKISGNEYAYCQAGGMSARDLCDHQFDGGVTIRQEFAARAMQGLAPLAGSPDGGWSNVDIVQTAVLLADALIAELNKPKS